MADYNISAEITADASGFESGIKKAQKASKNLSKSVSGVIQGLGKSGLVGALGAVGLATGGVVTVLNAVTKVAKKVAQTIDECSQAYRIQYQAEVALATAVNNNPYVDGTATKRLKEFASEMQRVSDVGDEQMLPMMADLIAKGRTEEETMQIMKVALDMSAGGAMSLDTAITQLNATLNGNVGRLGQQNSELKDLTEEELKQGKAVEILGEKYKGLSKATADSQKQLKNAVGDLKENMGQIFEQALAPMRNFFTEVITNLNNSITKSRELKSSMKEVFGDDGDVNLGASTDALNTAFTEILHKQQEVSKNYRQYIQLYGKYIDVSTDETALSYQSQITTLENQLKEISEELNKRRKESEEEKKRLAQARADEEAQKELEKQKELRAKELVLENEWADKLFAIRLENLEATRDKELENEKLTQEEREAIVDFYGEQILAMKIKQIEKERDEALKQENLTEEAKRAINLYYENRITNAKKDEEEKRLKLKKKTSEEEVKDEKKKFAEMLKVAGEYTKKLAETLKNVTKKIASKIASTVKSVISSVGNIFTKLFEFKPDEALDNLLKFEDAILTFFVETLPKLPSFFASAFQSVAVLIQTIFNIIDFDNIANIIGTIEKGLFDLITTIAKSINGNANRLTKGFVQIVKTIIEGLANWISSGGWKEFLDLLLLIQTSLEEAVAQNADLFAETLAKMLPDLVDMLIKSIVSASRTLGKIAKSLLPLVAKVINAVIEVITSNEVIEASIEAVGGLVEGLIPAIVNILVNALPRIINLFLLKLPSYTPQLITGIINGIVNALSEMDFVVIVDAFFDGFADALSNFDLGSMTDGLSKLFQKLFSFDFWIDSFANITEALVELIKKAFTSINFTSLFTSGGSSGGSSNSGGSSGGYIGQGTIVDPNPATNPITKGVVDTVKKVGEKLKKLFGFANGSNAVPSGLALVGEAGPELIRFNGGEQVLNNRNTNKALANVGKANNTFNVTFNNLQDTTAFAMMSQLKAYNRQMAINGIM